jgi:hypothetical protein
MVAAIGVFTSIELAKCATSIGDDLPGSVSACIWAVGCFDTVKEGFDPGFTLPRISYSIQLRKWCPRMKSLLKYVLWAAALLVPLCLPHNLYGQEYSVRAIDATSGKPLRGIPITLRHGCTTTGSGTNVKVHCKFIQRKTGNDGIAHFPEAGSLGDIDDIFSTPIEYGAVCCDISKPVIPGMGTIKFARRTLKEMLHWMFIGD